MLGTQNTKTVVVALLGVVALVVAAVPAAGHEASPDEHSGGGPQMSGYAIHPGADNQTDALVAIQLDEWGHVSERRIGAVRQSRSTPREACTAAMWCTEPTEGGVGGLAFGPDGTLFGIQGGDLVTISTVSGRPTTIGSLGETVPGGPLTFDCSGDLWMISRTTTNNQDRSSTVYNVDPDTGAATEVGQLGHPVIGLAARGGTVFGLGPYYNNAPWNVSGSRDADLLTVDFSTSSAAQVGALNTRVDAGELAFAPDGTLWGVGTDSAEFRQLLFAVDTDSGAATVLAQTESNYRTLAIRGEPVCGQVVAAPASSGGTTAAGGGPVGGEAPGPTAGRTATREGGNDSGQPVAPSGGSDGWRVADRSPTGTGVAAGEPDGPEEADAGTEIAAAGSGAADAGDRAGSGAGWIALVVAFVVAGLAALGFGGWSRLGVGR